MKMFSIKITEGIHKRLKALADEEGRKIQIQVHRILDAALPQSALVTRKPK